MFIHYSVSENKNKPNFCDEEIKNYFDTVEIFYKDRKEISEYGLFTLSQLIIIKSDISDELLKKTMIFISYALKNYRNIRNFKISCFVLIKIVKAIKNKFILYLEDIIKIFKNIIKSEDAEKNNFWRNHISLFQFFSIFCKWNMELLWKSNEIYGKYYQLFINNINKIEKSPINDDDYNY